jgi:hypothetical protein
MPEKETLHFCFFQIKMNIVLKEYLKAYLIKLTVNEKLFDVTINYLTPSISISHIS